MQYRKLESHEIILPNDEFNNTFAWWVVDESIGMTVKAAKIQYPSVKAYRRIKTY